MWQPEWTHELVTRVFDLAYAGVIGFLGWSLRAWSDRRRTAAEERVRRRQVCMDFVTAVGEATGLAEAHRAQWLSPRERMMLLAEASAGLIAGRPQHLADLPPHLPSLMGVVRKWQKNETQAARAEILPAIKRVAQGSAAVSLLGDDDLSRSAQDVTEAANALIGTMAARSRPRRAAQEQLEDAVRVFGQRAGLAIEKEHPSRLRRLLRRRTLE